MLGMHRDKCGAATVVGFFKVLSILQPKGLKAVAILPFVRNGVGPEAYTCDEIIRARSGKRVRIGNTDAEGRMILADNLCYAKEMALSEVNPRLFTIATLTGHAYRTVGDGYSIIIDNGPAAKLKMASRIQTAGDLIGDPFEISTLRREDYAFVTGKSDYEDLIQCNSKPSVASERGHQFPAAFLVLVSGLEKHGNDSEQPIPYSHIDMAGAEGPFPGYPYGNPVPSLCATFILPRIN